MLKFKKFISLVLVFVILFQFAPLQVKASSHKIDFDEHIFTDPIDGKKYIYKLSLDAYGRTSYIYDINRNLVSSFSYNPQTGLLRDNISGEFELRNDNINLFSYYQIDFSKIINSSDVKYDYCNRGSEYSQDYTTTVGVLLGIKAAKVLTTAFVIGKIAAFVGLSKIETLLNGGIVAKLIDLAMSGNLGEKVNMRIVYRCMKMWESDPFDPAGGFYFRGYMPISIT